MKSLKNKMLASFLPIVGIGILLPVVLEMVFLIRREHVTLKKQLHAFEQSVDLEIEDLEQETWLASGVVLGEEKIHKAVKANDRRGLLDIFQRFRGTLRADAVEVIAPDGTVLVEAHHPTRYGHNESYKPLFGKALSGRGQRGVGKSDLGLGVLVFLPIKENKRVIGVLEVSRLFNLDFLNKIKDKYGLEVMIHDGDRLQATTFTNSRIIMDPSLHALRGQVKREKTSVMEEIKLAGVMHFVSCKPVLSGKGELLGVMVLALSHEKTHERIRYVCLTAGGMALGILAVVTLICIRISHQIVKPLGKLSGAARMITEGNTPSRVEVFTRDEVGELAQPFNELSEALKGATATIDKLHQEMAARKEAEAELRHLRNYLSNIIDSMPSVLVGVDDACRVTLWNKTAEQTTGIPVGAAKGKELSEVFPRVALSMEKISASLKSRETKQERKRSRRSEGAVGYEDLTIYPLVGNGVEGAVIRIDDVTDKVRMEEVVIQTEKMLSVGGLAAGMAHEINNPIAAVMQNANVMANRLDENSNIPANLKAAEAAGTTMEAVRAFMEARGILRMIGAIDESAHRVATIVDNMLSFARKSDARVSPLLLSGLIDKTLDLAAGDYDLKKRFDFKKIRIEKEYGDNVPPVPCEGAKIQQVLLNILRNGAQAMQGAGIENPLLIVRLRFEKERKVVCVEVEDNGPGMDEATRKRVFEPFFTTKPVGMGTGLGLSVSYFIITENHGGEMAVESRPGSGAKFIIRLSWKRSGE